jgi:hypothetical protein
LAIGGAATEGTFDFNIVDTPIARIRAAHATRRHTAAGGSGHVAVAHPAIFCDLAGQEFIAPQSSGPLGTFGRRNTTVVRWLYHDFIPRVSIYLGTFQCISAQRCAMQVLSAAECSIQALRLSGRFFGFLAYRFWLTVSSSAFGSAFGFHIPTLAVVFLGRHIEPNQIGTIGRDRFGFGDRHTGYFTIDAIGRFVQRQPFAFRKFNRLKSYQSHGRQTPLIE